MESPKGSTWLWLSLHQNGAYRHIVGRILVQRDPDARKPSDEGLRNAAGAHDDLEVRCTMTADLDNGAPYGWCMEYRGAYAVDLPRAEEMAKTLRTVQRKCDRLAAKYGAPATFAEYVVRMGEALGVAGYVVARGAASWHVGTDWQRMDGAGARAWVERQIVEVRAEMGCGAAAAPVVQSSGAAVEVA